jgi:hypothetical protein
MIDKKNVSPSAQEIRELLDEAIKSGEITRNGYDKIVHIATADNVIDSQEKVLLAQLNDLLENKDIKIVMEPTSGRHNQI